MSVGHEVGLSCIQWRASNRQGIPPVGVAWSSYSSMQGLLGEGRGVHYTRRACCNAAVRAISAQRAGMGRHSLLFQIYWLQWRSQVFESGVHEKPDLPETFHERRIRKFGGESRGPSSPHPHPEKKLNLWLAEMQFPAALTSLLALSSLFLINLLSSY